MPEREPTRDEGGLTCAQARARVSAQIDQFDADVVRYRALIDLAAVKGPAVVAAGLGEANYVLFVRMMAVKLAMEFKRQDLQAKGASDPGEECGQVL